jgi:hypothetical protein
MSSEFTAILIRLKLVNLASLVANGKGAYDCTRNTYSFYSEEDLY